jgi:hypothetical protein
MTVNTAFIRPNHPTVMDYAVGDCVFSHAKLLRPVFFSRSVMVKIKCIIGKPGGASYKIILNPQEQRGTPLHSGDFSRQQKKVLLDGKNLN